MIIKKTQPHFCAAASACLVEILADCSFAYFLALLLDEDAVFGVSHADALEVVVFYGSILVVSLDAVNAGVTFLYFLEFDVSVCVPVAVAGVGIFAKTYPYFSRLGKSELYALTPFLTFVCKSSCSFSLTSGVVSASTFVFLYRKGYSQQLHLP